MRAAIPSRCSLPSPGEVRIEGRVERTQSQAWDLTFVPRTSYEVVGKNTQYGIRKLGLAFLLAARERVRLSGPDGLTCPVGVETCALRGPSSTAFVRLTSVLGEAASCASERAFWTLPPALSVPPSCFPFRLSCCPVSFNLRFLTQTLNFCADNRQIDDPFSVLVYWVTRRMVF